MGVEYDGSRFHGWQSQPDGETVQSQLEKAISVIAGSSVKVAAAGRTDSGVHALEQVAHFDTDAARPLQAWVRGVNSHLPSAIAVRWAVEVHSEFHARFSAISRSYRYILLNHPVRPAVCHGRVGWFHRPLNTDAMRDAAQLLVGEHDFTSFRSSECQASSPIKKLHKAEIFRDGETVVFDFCAGGFLHHMVWNIVGSLLWIGYGKEQEKWLGDLLIARDRTLAAPTFPPDGLYFVGAEYEKRWALPQMVMFDRMMPALNLLRQQRCVPESRSVD